MYTFQFKNERYYNRNQKEKKRLADEIIDLSPEKKRAVYWLINHINLVEHLIKGEKMTQKKLNKSIQEAFEQKNYTLMAILLYKKRYDTYETK